MRNQRPAFQWRVWVSVLVLLSFAVLMVSGLVLYIAPPGRVANWTDWALGGLRKSEWINLHTAFALLFVIVGLIHVILNWRPLVGYFKQRATRRFALRAEWVTALVLAAVVVVGSRAGWPPCGQITALSERIKESWDAAQERAPIPHAELLTVAELAKQANVPLETATARLREHKEVADFTPETVVKDLAARSGLSAQELYRLMTPRQHGGGKGPGQNPGRGGGIGRGVGWKTLSAFCAEEGIEVDVALARLKAGGFQATPDQTLKEIAQTNGFDHPFEMLKVLRGQGEKPAPKTE